MTIQELFNELSKIEDKSGEVIMYIDFGNGGESDVCIASCYYHPNTKNFYLEH